MHIIKVTTNKMTHSNQSFFACGEEESFSYSNSEVYSGSVNTSDRTDSHVCCISSGQKGTHSLNSILKNGRKLLKKTNCNCGCGCGDPFCDL